MGSGALTELPQPIGPWLRALCARRLRVECLTEGVVVVVVKLAHPEFRASARARMHGLSVSARGFVVKRRGQRRMQRGEEHK